MWRQRKTWKGPTHPWQKQRLIEEAKLMKEYGLKNKKELWKAKTIARNIRFYARQLNAKAAMGLDISKESERFLAKLKKYGFVSENATLDDTLNITERDILDRRLQTLVWRKGLARTVKQARQLIVHGHIVVGDRVITAPGYLVKVEEEELISYHPFSPLSNPEHPLVKSIKETKVEKEEEVKEEVKTSEESPETEEIKEKTEEKQE